MPAMNLGGSFIDILLRMSGVGLNRIEGLNILGIYTEENLLARTQPNTTHLNVVERRGSLKIISPLHHQSIT